MQAWFEKQWQQTGLAQIVLLPLSWVFQFLVAIRRYLYEASWLKSYSLPVPVIVVGNITVGGTGKTPTVIYLVEQLKLAGYHPGIVSRGYGGIQTGLVLPDSLPNMFGDEPVMLAKRTQCPVWVNPDRVAAGQALLKAFPQCNVIISDDGLQHYRLQRNVEIVVINSMYAFGNYRLLPAGPMRENLNRLTQVTAIVDTANKTVENLRFNPSALPVFRMSLVMQGILSLDDTHKISLNELQQQSVVAIAGIGHPQRFFGFVKGLGLSCEYFAFNDHHEYTQKDFEPFTGKTILMTEKDAVKCKHLSLRNAWYLPVSAMLDHDASDSTLMDLVIQQLKKS